MSSINYLEYMRKGRKVIFSKAISSITRNLNLNFYLECYSVDDLSVHYLQIRVWEILLFF